MARTVIEELITLFGFQTDKEGARAAMRTYTDLHHAARDLIGIANRAASALLSPIRKVVELGEQAYLTGRRLGMTAQEVQALDTAARLTGVSSSSLIQVIEKMGASSFKAATRHKEHVLAFSRLGVAFTQNGRLKSNSQLFFDAVEKLAGLENAGKRAALGYQIFGERIGQVMPLISMGAGYFKAIREAAEDAGAIMSNETAEAARDLSFWWRLLELRAEGVEKRIGSGLIPVASQVVGTMTALFRANKAVIDQHLDVTIRHISDAVYFFAKIFQGAFFAVEDLVDMFGGFKNVLTVVEVILGATFLAALGAATAAIVRLGVAILFANALPALMALVFGVLLGVLALVVQDLNSTNSLLKDLWNNPWNTENDPPILKTLKLMVQLFRALEKMMGADAPMMRFFGGAFDFTKFQEELNQIEGRRALNAPAQVGANAPEWLKEDMRNKAAAEGRVSSDRAAVALMMSEVSPTAETKREMVTEAAGRIRERAWGWTGLVDKPITIEVNQTFTGAADPAAVKTATTAGVTAATEDDRLRALYDAVRSGHQ